MMVTDGIWSVDFFFYNQSNLNNKKITMVLFIGFFLDFTIIYTFFFPQMVSKSNRLMKAASSTLFHFQHRQKKNLLLFSSPVLK